MITQVKVLTPKLHEVYNKDFFETPLSFEDFVNFQLGQLYDEQRYVKSVRFSEDLSTCIIVYTMKV